MDSGGKQGAFSRGAAEERPLTIRYKAKCDNGLTKFHSARFERMPTPDPEVWYGLVPTKRSPVLKNLPLSCSGSEFAVAQQTVELFHDRTKALTLCKFYNGNFNIQSKPKTENRQKVNKKSAKSKPKVSYVFFYPEAPSAPDFWYKSKQKLIRSKQKLNNKTNRK